MTAPGGEEIRYGYDGDLVTSEQAVGTNDATVRAHVRRRLRLVATAIDGGSNVDFRYDDDGLLVGAGALDLTLEAASGRVQSDRVGDVPTAYGYDSFGDVTGITTSTGVGPLLAVELERDRLGRIVRRTEAGAPELTYEYDDAGRLSAVERDGEPW